ncbi:3-hydroxybutyryl-coA dehydrogenase [Physcia stellaris]|nr:3-hydroxybutyryl-coA dehydrogenase [Physcia stellaris]
MPSNAFKMLSLPHSLVLPEPFESPHTHTEIYHLPTINHPPNPTTINMSSNTQQYSAGGTLLINTDIWFPTIAPPSPKPRSCGLEHSKFAKFFVAERDSGAGIKRNKPASVDLGAPYRVAFDAVAVHGSGLRSGRFGRLHYSCAEPPTYGYLGFYIQFIMSQFRPDVLRVTSQLKRNWCLRRYLSTSPAMAAAEVKRLGVVGAGQMGLGIALVAAQKARIPVTLVDSSQASLDKGLKFAGEPERSRRSTVRADTKSILVADRLLEKDVSKSRISQSDASEARSRLEPTTNIEDLSSADFIIEAVPEILDLKTSIFSQLAKIAPSHAILATNTSSISITKIAAATTPKDNPTDLTAASRVISTHFMNPVPVQKGVEIISGLQTSPSTVEIALDFMKRMGKIPSQSADSPGFLANRILMPYINEAIICFETGVGGKEDIDNIMKNGTNVPMGPLQLADFIGLDTCLAIMKVLHTETGDSKYRPSVLLSKMVDAGWLGKKSGKGFYDY